MSETALDETVEHARRGVRRFLQEYEIEPALFAELASVAKRVIDGLLNGTVDPDAAEMKRITWVLGQDYVWESGRLRLSADKLVGGFPFSQDDEEDIDAGHKPRRPDRSPGGRLDPTKYDGFPYRHPTVELSAEEHRELCAKVQAWLTVNRVAKWGFGKIFGIGLTAVPDLLNGKTTWTPELLDKIRDAISRPAPKHTPAARPAAMAEPAKVPSKLSGSDSLRAEIFDFMRTHGMTRAQCQVALGVNDATMENIMSGGRIMAHYYIRGQMAKHEEKLRVQASLLPPPQPLPPPPQLSLPLAEPPPPPPPPPAPVVHDLGPQLQGLLDAGFGAVCKRLDKLSSQLDTIISIQTQLAQRSAYKWQ